MNSTERKRRGSEPPGRTDRRQHAFCPPHQVRARTTRHHQHKEQPPIRIRLYVYSTPLPAHPGRTNPCRGIGGPERAIAIAKHARMYNCNNLNIKSHKLESQMLRHISLFKSQASEANNKSQLQTSNNTSQHQNVVTYKSQHYDLQSLV